MTPVDLHHVIDGPDDAPAVVLFPSLGSTLFGWFSEAGYDVALVTTFVGLLGGLATLTVARRGRG